MNDSQDIQRMRVALNAVLQSAKIAETTGQALVINRKDSLRDIVTQADVHISQLITSHLQATGIAVVSEESPASHTQLPSSFWVIDPIDGTANFTSGMEQYAIAIGLVEDKKFKQGVVCAPALNELYFTLNSRAFRNGSPLYATDARLENALIAASFSAHAPIEEYAMFHQVNRDTRGCLRTGSASLNICWVAAGKMQAAYGFNAKLWDVAAALAIATAAGYTTILTHSDDFLSFNYCVGSKNIINHINQLAINNRLWK